MPSVGSLAAMYPSVALLVLYLVTLKILGNSEKAGHLVGSWSVG